MCQRSPPPRAEALQRQALEDPDEVEWIYLRNTEKQWVARRTPRHPTDPPPDRSIWQVIRGSFTLEDLFWP